MRDGFDVELEAERFIRYVLDNLDYDQLSAWLDDGQTTPEWHDEVEHVGALLNSGRLLIDWNYGTIH